MIPLAALALVLPLLAAASMTPAEPPVRVSGAGFGEAVEIEVRGLDPEGGEAAERAALLEIAALERLADPAAPVEAGGVAALNAAAGQGPRPVEPRLFALLARALEVCRWSEGAHGPLGGQLYRLWGLRGRAEGLPTPERLAPAAAAAGCEGLKLDARRSTAALPAGAVLDLWGFAEGWAVDRAVELLRERGARTGLVRMGSLWRSFGGGPDGRGYRLALPAFGAAEHPAGELWLLDRAIAVAAAAERPLRIAGESFAPYLNQRTGRPPEGTLATVVVAERALDAEALAATMLVTGAREGQLRLGVLNPHPAVLWALGSGEGYPLYVEYNWSEVPKVRRPGLPSGRSQ